MRLYLVRHGQTAWNVEGRAQGHTDIPLDPTGLDQARRLGSWFEGRRVDRILSSDLARAVQTAEPIAAATGAAVVGRQDLRERGFGEWEGVGFAEVTRSLAERAEAHCVSRQEVRPPGGESFQDVWNRLDGVVTELEQEDGEIVVVTHGGTASLLLARMVQGSLATSRSFRFSNTGVSILHRRAEGQMSLVHYNLTEHLEGKALAGGVDGTTR